MGRGARCGEGQRLFVGEDGDGGGVEVQRFLYLIVQYLGEKTGDLEPDLCRKA